MNVALGRPTFQSSVRGGRGASLAVDGNRNPDADNVGSCSVMDVATRAWWTVDLGAVVNVKEVAISQRDQYGELRETLNYISDHVTVGNLVYYLTIYVNAVSYMFCICYKAVS